MFAQTLRSCPENVEKISQFRTAANCDHLMQELSPWPMCGRDGGGGALESGRNSLSWKAQRMEWVHMFAFRLPRAILLGAGLEKRRLSLASAPCSCPAPPWACVERGARRLVDVLDRNRRGCVVGVPLAARPRASRPLAVCSIADDRRCHRRWLLLFAGCCSSIRRLRR